MKKSNIVLMSDSYKYSQFNQYPPDTVSVYSYIEARSSKRSFDTVKFFGLQAFIQEYLTTPVTMQDIYEAKAVIEAHGEPFNYEGWKYIVDKHNGYLPVKIRAVPEGAVVPLGVPLVVVENTDPECYWLTSFLETAILRAVWYPTTVCTNSYETKKIILKALEETGDPTGIDFKLHDFGARGVSSEESAAIGGAAHLVNFRGTDTVSALGFIAGYYKGSIAEGYSIPAMEHSTVTSWGKENEVQSYRNMLNNYAKPGAIIAAVSDSYDIYAACHLWGTELKQQVLDSGATVVIRPDSGNPTEVALKCLQILESHFGSAVNSKGFKVLNNVRLIWGDGITMEVISNILFVLKINQYSADNIAFGQGGALLQGVTRDDFGFAVKCSSIGIRDSIRAHGVEYRDVYKDPVTDSGKKSKRGRVVAYKNKDGKYFSGVEDWTDDAMNLVFYNGIIEHAVAFDQVRNQEAKDKGEK